MATKQASKRIAQLGTADTVVGYLELLLGKRQESEEEWIFRGQRDGTKRPVPKIDRPEFAAYRKRRGWDRLKHEDRLLTDFKKGARPHVAVPPASLWEWLAVAQHHGLATRLLDWTANPLAALFFAVEVPDVATDSAVWCYYHRGYSWMWKPNRKDPFKIKDVTSFWPPHVSPRITVQAGCFTAHPDPAHSTSGRWPGALLRITIPGAARRRLRLDLSKIGVTRASLFPDLDGIAAAHNRRLSEDPLRRPVG